MEENEDKPVEEKVLSKSAQKRRKKKEKEASKVVGQGPTFGLPNARTSEQQDAVAMAKYLLGDVTSSQNQATSTQNVDPEKRMKTLKKVL